MATDSKDGKKPRHRCPRCGQGEVKVGKCCNRCQFRLTPGELAYARRERDRAQHFRSRVGGA